MHETDFLFDEPSSPNVETEKESLGPRHLTGSQVAALNRLVDLARLRGQCDRGGVKLRNKPLIVGPSGCGKTAVVRRLCDVEELPLLVVAAGSWIVYGAKTTPHTLTVIKQFVADNPTCCVFLDEVDKCLPGRDTFGQTWDLSIFTEIVSLLDSDSKLQNFGWQPKQIERLRQSHCLIGAGAWQAHVAGSDGVISPDNGYVGRIVKNAGIPTEILRRFHPRITSISLPNTKDFAAAIRRVRADLSLPALPANEETQLAGEAVKTDYGMRWMEGYLAELLIQCPQLTSPKPKAEPARDVVSISREELARIMAGMVEQLDALRKPSKELEVKFNLARVIATNSSPEQRKNFLEPDELTSVIREIQGLCPGLAYGLSATEKERLRRQTQVQVHGGHLLRLLDTWLSDKAFSLKSCGALEAAIHLQVGLRRVLDIWQYLGRVDFTA
jgi:hypothetical protein